MISKRGRAKNKQKGVQLYYTILWVKQNGAFEECLVGCRNTL